MSDASSAQNVVRPVPPVPRPPQAAPANGGGNDPKFRHEFVGMMFAVTVGEVGLQTAALVKAKDFLHFLPAYSHLILATVIIATSWVGWTLSKSRGGQKDVGGIFEREFLILLLDVALVILYFILVRAVDFVGEGETIRLRASARPEASWVWWIFLLYVIWDIVAKWPVKEKVDRVRMAPSVACLVLASVVWVIVRDADAPHVLTADFALLSLILFFRALKDVASAYFSKDPPPADLPRRRTLALRWSVVSGIGLLVGLIWTCSGPLPQSIVDAIQRMPAN